MINTNQIHKELSNSNIKITRLCHKLLDDNFLNANGRIKEELKFKINIPQFNIQNSTISGKPEDTFETMLFLPHGEGRQGEGGLRTKGYFKHSYKLVDGKWFIVDSDNNPVIPAPEVIQSEIKQYLSSNAQYQKPITELPLITVITVVYNGEKYLEETIQSVINQTYPNVEYIIIDGGSTDGTLDIIKKYEHAIDYWVSEPDRGIYDAMNKGIDVATGDWINFMNTGDSFFDNVVLEKLFVNNDLEKIDVIYGNHQVIYTNRKRIAKAGNIEDIWKGSQFCHQSSFVSSRVHKVNKYNLCNKIGADFELFYVLYKYKKTFKYMDVIVANYSAGGLSDIERIDSIVSRWNVIEKNTKANLYYSWTVLKEILKSWVKRVVGR
ncbi:MAG: hypothetical protein PWQ25_1620 [Deferribacteres bacterium]|jgi:hypothetical protein|nr:hypothetical protein [Deferribacteres bacterium]